MSNTNDLFNHEFYTSTYDDTKKYSKSQVDSFDHWNKHGKAEGRVCNIGQYYKLLAQLTSFNYEIYVNCNVLLKNFKNVATELNFKNESENLDGAFEYFYESNINKKNPKNLPNTNLNVPHIHMTNQNELDEYIKKWDELYIKMHEYTKFDYKFYWEMYSDSVADDSFELFKLWLTTDMFNDKMRNDTDKIDNLRVFIGGIAKEINFDWVFFKNKYKTTLAAYNKLNLNSTQSMDNEVGAFWYFINYARDLKLCLNEMEYNAYISKYTTIHEDAIKIIKAVENKHDLPLIEKKYHDKCYNFQKSNISSIIHSLPKHTDIKFLTASYLNTVLSEEYIKNLANAFKTNNDLKQKILVLVKKEIVKFKKNNDNIQSMEFKTFVANVIYNGLISMKGDKTQYIEMVKATIVNLYKELNSTINDDEIKALENDIEFIINNKKIIKLTCMTAKLAIALML